MLQMLAELLREQFPGGGLYRVGGDEVVVFPAREEACRPRMSAVARHLAARGYSIAYGVATAQSTVGLRTLVREADTRMLEEKRAYYASRAWRSPRG